LRFVHLLASDRLSYYWQQEVLHMSQSNQKTIEAVYAAFGRGDVAFILQRVSDAIQWDFSVGKSEVPWHAPVRGKAELPRFFQALAENVVMQAFEPRMFIDDGRSVVVKLRLAYTVKRTGKQVDEEQVQWWSFDDGGRISGLRHYEDTAAVRDAWS
jgi:ketosteroid isomerase-like protein